MTADCMDPQPLATRPWPSCNPRILTKRSELRGCCPAHTTVAAHHFLDDQTLRPLFVRALPLLERVLPCFAPLVRTCPGLFCLSCCFAVCAPCAQITNTKYNLAEHALMHVPNPGEFVYEHTDREVESSLALLIIACRVAITCAKILSLLLPIHATLLHVFCSPREGS